ncbi:hypothetical protein Dda_4433 [Drechslerella dactyloides]|uniref:Ribosomal protein/NADH dehydrogenase domain-containing protein n=1 Tax=Drechslerella dactyloides TaxID=74499 RepID=A0AAD6IYA0_DREDA|nr:hypothetical protein Dda_4433 [Drechslerella dactyloides]
MPSPVARFRWLRAKLHSIRNGTGAVILPPTVHRLSLILNYRGANGHLGAGKFLRECLPRLKFHNPEVDMPVSINRAASTGPATLTVHFCDPPPPPPPNATNHTPKPTKTPTTTSTLDIDMLDRLPDEIMAELTAKASGTPYTEPARRSELADEAEYLRRRREGKLREKFTIRRQGRPKRKEKEGKVVSDGLDGLIQS